MDSEDWWFGMVIGAIVAAIVGMLAALGLEWYFSGWNWAAAGGGASVGVIGFLIGWLIFGYVYFLAESGKIMNAIFQGVFVPIAGISGGGALAGYADRDEMPTWIEGMMIAMSVALLTFSVVFAIAYWIKRGGFD